MRSFAHGCHPFGSLARFCVRVFLLIQSCPRFKSVVVPKSSPFYCSPFFPFAFWFSEIGRARAQEAPGAARSFHGSSLRTPTNPGEPPEEKGGFTWIPWRPQGDGGDSGDLMPHQSSAAGTSPRERPHLGAALEHRPSDVDFG
jgi:hypothetical protein